MKSLKNLGKSLNKKQQKAISGGEFCQIHCLGECHAIHPYGSQALEACSDGCKRGPVGNNGGSGGGSGGGNGGGDPILDTGF